MINHSIRHSPKNWAMVGLFQLGIIVASFSLPNSIINGATWYAQIIDFGRIALLFGFTIGDFVILARLAIICKRRKAYLAQFIDDGDRLYYDSINSFYFLNLTHKQIDTIELAFRNSREDCIIDPDLPFKLLQGYIY